MLFGRLTERLARFVGDRAAVTALEYVLIAAFLSILVLLGASRIGSELSSVFVKVSAGL
jgi:pilus assembly protein Flp/PilA